MKSFNERCFECKSYFISGSERTFKEWQTIVETLSSQMGGMLTDKDRITMLMLMDGTACRPSVISEALSMQPGTVSKYLNKYYLPRGLITKSKNNRYSIYPEGFQKWIQHVIDGTQQAPLVPMVTVKPSTITGEKTLTVEGALTQLIIELNKDPEFLDRRLCEFLQDYDEDDKTTIQDRFNQLYNAKRKELVPAFMIYMIKANRRDMIEYWAENLLTVEDLYDAWPDGLIHMIEVDYSKPY